MNSIFIKRSVISSQHEEVLRLSLNEDIYTQILDLRDLSSLDEIGVREIGQIFTPSLIVTKILNLIGYRSNSNIRDKLILDPSCGMGAFITEAVRRLRENLIIKYGYDPKRPEDALQIVKYVNKNIHGIDISEIAARNAAISYLFPLKEEISAILKANPSYKPQVSIYTFDTLDHKFRPRVDFDFIVGNPPYIQASKLKPSLREVYKKHYWTAKTRFNLYGLFYERSISWLKDGGTLGFISPNRFFHTDYGKRLRSLLLAKTQIKTIIDFKDTNVFKEVETYPTIVIARKVRRLKSNWHFPYSYVQPAKRANSLELENWKEDRVIQKLNFPVKQSRLSSEPWILIPDNILNLLSNIMKRHIPLHYFCGKISAGIATGSNDVFVFDQKPKNIEERLLIPVIRGRDVKRNKIDWKGTYLLNPYEFREGRIEPIEIDEFPKAKRYLAMSKNRLISKYHAKYNKKKWFETHDTINPGVITKRKIVFPDIAQENRFAIDDGRYHCLNTCYYILPKSEYGLDYLIALLNSELMEIMVKVKSPKISQGHYRYMKRYIKDLPIIDPNKIEKAIIESIVNLMKKEDWKQLDDFVYELYDVPRKTQAKLKRLLKHL